VMDKHGDVYPRRFNRDELQKVDPENMIPIFRREPGAYRPAITQRRSPTLRSEIELRDRTVAPEPERRQSGRARRTTRSEEFDYSSGEAEE